MDIRQNPKPRVGRYKCNVDALFSNALNIVGIRICIRMTIGDLSLAKPSRPSPIVEVNIGKALELLSALNWMRSFTFA